MAKIMDEWKVVVDHGGVYLEGGTLSLRITLEGSLEEKVEHALMVRAKLTKEFRGD